MRKKKYKTDLKTGHNLELNICMKYNRFIVGKYHISTFLVIITGDFVLFSAMFSTHPLAADN